MWPTHLPFENILKVPSLTITSTVQEQLENFQFDRYFGIFMSGFIFPSSRRGTKYLTVIEQMCAWEECCLTRTLIPCFCQIRSFWLVQNFWMLWLSVINALSQYQAFRLSIIIRLLGSMYERWFIWAIVGMGKTLLVLTGSKAEHVEDGNGSKVYGSTPHNM